MKKLSYFTLALLIVSTALFAQEQKPPTPKKGHYNISKFKQLKEELATPNMFRTASGAPGPAYYQQQADYKMDIILDDKNQRLMGQETITYYNNSPDELTYLWVQLDQNMRAPNSKTPDIKSGNPSFDYRPQQYVENFMEKTFPGGFHIDYVKDINNNDIKYLIAGGLAVVAHGYVRFTADIDLILDLSETNVKEAMRIFKELGFITRAPVNIESFADKKLREQWIQEKNLKMI